MARTSRTSRRLATALAVAGALVPASSALAIPAGGGGNNPPLNDPPAAILKVTPNPVVIPAPLVLQPGRAISNALPDAIPVLGGATVTFDASASFDDDGSIAKYEWDLDGQPGFERSTTTAKVTRRYTATGDIPVKVRVTDNRGATDTATVTLKAHRAPTAQITGKKVAVVGEGLSFTAVASDDNGVASVQWDMDGDGVFERTGTQASTSFGTTGPHTVSLRVTDTLGAVTTTSLVVRVHRPPVALIVTQPPTPVVNRPTTLDGSRSTDDGSIAKYEWDLNGDGVFETSTGAVPRATTTFTKVGPASVGLRVTDNDGATDQTRLQVQVSATPTATADSAGPRVRLARTRLAMSKKAHQVSLRVACPASEQLCAVRVRLTGRTGALAGRLLGSGRVQIQGGTSRTLKVTLSRRAQRAVGLRAVKARAVMTATDGSGNTAVTRTGITIHR